MRIRLPALLAVIGIVAAAVVVALTGTTRAPHKGSTMRGGTVERSLPLAAQPAVPRPLHGVPLAGSTGLRLLVSSDPPFVLNVDTGMVQSVTGLNVHGNPVITVLPVGRDAVVWLDRRAPSGGIPRAEIYVVRHGTTRAVRIATGWQVAPAAGGRAIWLLRYTDPHHCTSSEIGLNGGPLERARPVSCSSQLADSGSGPVLVHGRLVVDAATRRTLVRTRGLWAIGGGRALSAGPGSGPPLALIDLRTGTRWRLPWPSRVGSTDQAVVRPDGQMIALNFADPAYQGSGTQVTDVWLFDPATRHFQHLPDMPAAVQLKFTSMAWASGDRLVMLAGAAGAHRNLVAVWRPGQRQIALRTVRLPIRNNGSDSFIVW